MTSLTDSVPATPGWAWRRTHWDNFEVIGPRDEMQKFAPHGYVGCLDGPVRLKFRNYLELCWWCGGKGINPVEAA